MWYVGTAYVGFSKANGFAADKKRSDQMFCQKIQGKLDSLRSDGFSVAAEDLHLFQRFGRRGQTEPDRADRFRRAAAARACDAGNAEGVVGLGDGFRTARHFVNGFAADRAVLQQRVGHDAEAFFFGLVAVSDETLMKPLRAARNAGERARQQPAGAGFGAGDGLAVSGKVFGDGLQGGHGMSFRWAGFPEILGWVETLL